MRWSWCPATKSCATAVAADFERRDMIPEAIAVIRPKRAGDARHYWEGNASGGGASARKSATGRPARSITRPRAKCSPGSQARAGGRPAPAAASHSSALGLGPLLPLEQAGLRSMP